MKSTYNAIPLILPALAVTLLASSVGVAQADSPPDPAQPQPVEKDMHEFMEYVFQPTFKRLKPLMAAEPNDNSGWKGIKADSLTLAEGGNLLLSRIVDKDREKWAEWSTEVRKAGGQVY